MLRTLTQTWWPLALCGVLDLANAALNLVMLNLDGSLALRALGTAGVVGDMSKLGVAAGACAIAAGLWNSGRECSWLLSLHGLGLPTFGLIGLSPLASLDFHALVFALTEGLPTLSSRRQLKELISYSWY